MVVLAGHVAPLDVEAADEQEPATQLALHRDVDHARLERGVVQVQQVAVVRVEDDRVLPVHEVPELLQSHHDWIELLLSCVPVDLRSLERPGVHSQHRVLLLSDGLAQLGGLALRQDAVVVEVGRIRVEARDKGLVVDGAGDAVDERRLQLLPLLGCLVSPSGSLDRDIGDRTRLPRLRFPELEGVVHDVAQRLRQPRQAGDLVLRPRHECDPLVHILGGSRQWHVTHCLHTIGVNRDAIGADQVPQELDGAPHQLQLLGTQEQLLLVARLEEAFDPLGLVADVVPQHVPRCVELLLLLARAEEVLVALGIVPLVVHVDHQPRRLAVLDVLERRADLLGEVLTRRMIAHH